jgi:hypothetical protein
MAGPDVMESRAVWLILEALRDLASHRLARRELRQLATTYTAIALDFGMSVGEVAEAVDADYGRVYAWAYAPYR